MPLPSSSDRDWKKAHTLVRLLFRSLLHHRLASFKFYNQLLPLLFQYFQHFKAPSVWTLRSPIVRVESLPFALQNCLRSRLSSQYYLRMRVVAEDSESSSEEVELDSSGVVQASTMCYFLRGFSISLRVVVAFPIEVKYVLSSSNLSNIWWTRALTFLWKSPLTCTFRTDDVSNTSSSIIENKLCWFLLELFLRKTRLCSFSTLASTFKMVPISEHCSVTF